MLGLHRRSLINAFSALLLSGLLAACDSDNKSYGPIAYPDPEPPVDPKPEPTPLTAQITSLGGAYAGDGLVTVLVHQTSDNTFVAQNQNRDGRTLYVFANDPVGESTCTSSTCVTNWPPFLANEDSVAAPPLSLIEREGGIQQWAINGKPLYFYSADTAAGDVKGDGVGGVWHAALLEPVLLTTGDATIGAFWSARGEVLTTVPEPAGQNLTFAAATEDKAGFSLYTFANDSSGVSNCAGNCLVNWPALLAHPDDIAEPPFSIIERTLGVDGGPARQWAYQGQPLYFFSGDTAAGQTNGAAIANWAPARPLPWRVATTGHGSAFVAAGRPLSGAPGTNNDTVVSPVAKHGFALYTFANDASGVSNCSGNCLANWPALAAHPGAQPRGPFTVIARADGTSQWALNGRPLYFFANDTAAGDIKGDDLNNVWHLARIPPVAVDVHEEAGTLFVATEGLIDEAGAPDDTLAGYTLYIFADDTQGVSTCFNNCAALWPPLYAPANARNFGDFTVTSRNNPATPDDDTLNLKQWAYKGKPLYFYSGDGEPGDATGESGKWFFAGP